MRKKKMRRNKKDQLYCVFENQVIDVHFTLTQLSHGLKIDQKITFTYQSFFFLSSFSSRMKTAIQRISVTISLFWIEVRQLKRRV